ncbi:hypothetical protein [Undibacterium sp. TC4M20W]
MFLYRQEIDIIKAVWNKAQGARPVGGIVPQHVSQHQHAIMA